MPERSSRVGSISSGLAVAAHLSSSTSAGEHVVQVVQLSAAGSRRNAAAAAPPPTTTTTNSPNPTLLHKHKLPPPPAPLAQHSSPPRHSRKSVRGQKRPMLAKPNTNRSAPRWAGGGGRLFQSVAGRLPDSLSDNLPGLV